MSVQQLVVGSPDAGRWIDVNHGGATPSRLASLRETCHLLVVLALLLCLTLALFASTSLIDAALRAVANVG
jgi:hypothetical protein